MFRLYCNYVEKVREETKKSLPMHSTILNIALFYWEQTKRKYPLSSSIKDLG